MPAPRSSPRSAQARWPPGATRDHDDVGPHPHLVERPGPDDLRVGDRRHDRPGPVVVEVGHHHLVDLGGGGQLPGHPGTDRAGAHHRDADH